MKQIQDIPVPLYGPGSTTLTLPMDGILKGLWLDLERGEWGVEVEASTINSHSRFIDIMMDYVSAPVESTYTFLGKLERTEHEIYSIWWREKP